MPRTVQVVDVLVALLRQDLPVLVGNKLHVVVRIVQIRGVSHPVGVVEVVHLARAVEGEEIGARAVLLLLAIPAVLRDEPVVRVETLPQVEESVDVAVVQPEDWIERGHGDRAHVAAACSDVVSAGVVLSKSAYTRTSIR